MIEEAGVGVVLGAAFGMELFRISFALNTEGSRMGVSTGTLPALPTRHLIGRRRHRLTVSHT